MPALREEIRVSQSSRTGSKARGSDATACRFTVPIPQLTPFDKNGRWLEPSRRIGCVTGEDSERATRLSTVFVAADKIEALLEARSVYPGIIDDSEYESLLALLTMDLPVALGDPLFESIPVDLDDLNWNNPESVSNLKSAKAAALWGLARDFDIGFPDDIEGIDNALRLVANRATECCSLTLSICQPRLDEILIFDCVRPVYVFSDDEGVRDFGLMRFGKLLEVYFEYLQHYGASHMRVSPDPLRRYRHHLETRLRGSATQVGDENLSESIEDLIMAASEDDAFVVWDECMPQKINAVARAYEAARLSVPRRYLRASRAEEMFLESAEMALTEQVRLTNQIIQDALQGPSQTFPNGEGSPFPESPSIQLTADEEKEFVEARFKSRLPLDITGEHLKRATNVLQIGGRRVEIADADLVLLLRLVVALHASPNGFVPKGGGRAPGGLVEEQGIVPGRVDQAISRLRQALRPGIEGLDPKNLIEVQGGRLRLSTHPRFINVFWERLDDHPHEMVRRLLTQLRQFRADEARPVPDAR